MTTDMIVRSKPAPETLAALRHRLAARRAEREGPLLARADWVRRQAEWAMWATLRDWKHGPVEHPTRGKISRPNPLPASNMLAPDGRPFPWGQITRIHEVGPYRIVEFRVDASRHSATQPEAWLEHRRTRFDAYLNGRQVGWRCDNLASALVHAIAAEREGENSRAPMYFDRMTLTDKDDE